jgi:hypothetical protein
MSFKGAHLKGTTKYITLEQATKTNEYSCPKCTRDVVLVKQIENRRLHFAHKHKRAGECNHYDERRGKSDFGGESEIHFEAKIKLAETLKKCRTIVINQYCEFASVRTVSYPRCCTSVMYKIAEDDEVHTEYRKDDIILDVAVLDKDGVLKYALEIKKSHAQAGRPEPWFEFNANEILNDFQVLTCRRTDRPICTKCNGIKTPVDNYNSLLSSKRLKIRKPQSLNREESYTNPTMYSEGTDYSTRDILLDVPFSQKDTAKSYGARWDPDEQMWYAPSSNKITKCNHMFLVGKYGKEHRDLVYFSMIQLPMMSLRIIDYNEEVVSNMKRNWRMKWNQTHRSWEFHCSIFEEIINFFRASNYDVDTSRVSSKIVRISRLSLPSPEERQKRMRTE